jgi:hypothetical protein
VTCIALDQCHVAGICDPATGSCSHPAAANATVCNDGDAKTVGDVCIDGSCHGGESCLEVACKALDQCHLAGLCDKGTGSCSHPIKDDGSPCDDGDAGTVGDTCTNGVCAGVNKCLGVVCAPLDQCHASGTCDPATGACSTPVRSNGSACDDGDTATANDACTNGVCSGVDHCVGVTCTALDQCHLVGTCNHATGTCANPAKTEGDGCDDGNASTLGDVCVLGVCAGVQCLTGLDCPDPANPACNPVSKTCQPCVDDSGCADHAATPVCQADGTCRPALTFPVEPMPVDAGAPPAVMDAASEPAARADALAADTHDAHVGASKSPIFGLELNTGAVLGSLSAAIDNLKATIDGGASGPRLGQDAAGSRIAPAVGETAVFTGGGYSCSVSGEPARTFRSLPCLVGMALLLSIFRKRRR